LVVLESEQKLRRKEKQKKNTNCRILDLPVSDKVILES